MTEMNRPDGRELKELRKLSIEVGVLNRADGSARIRLGKNMVMASVFGPREKHPRFFAKAEKATVTVTYRMATFSVTDYKRSFPSRREKEISKVLSEAFESVVVTKHFPRSTIDVHVQIFESDGGTRTAASIAVSAALADAGIPMRDIMSGIASGLYKDNVCLDLNGQEDMKGTGDMPILYAPNLNEVSLFQLDGKFTLEQFKEAFYTSIEAIKLISTKIQDALKQKYIAIKNEIDIPEDSQEEEAQNFIKEEFVEPQAAEDVVTPTITDKLEGTNETPAFNDGMVSTFDPDDVPDGSDKETTEPASELIEDEKSSIETEHNPVVEQPMTTEFTSTEPVSTASIEESVIATDAEVSSNENTSKENMDWLKDNLGLRPMGGMKKEDEEK